MKRACLFVALCAIGALPPLHAAEATMSSADGTYTVAPKRITGGGGVSQGGSYRASLSIGQAEASRRLSGGNFTATLGLQAPALQPVRIFRDGFDDFEDGFEKRRRR